MLLRYEDAYQYRCIFEPLVVAQAEYDRQEKALLTQSVGQVRWDIGLNKKPQAYFKLPKFSEGSKYSSLATSDKIIPCGFQWLQNRGNLGSILKSSRIFFLALISNITYSKQVEPSGYSTLHLLSRMPSPPSSSTFPFTFHSFKSLWLRSTVVTSQGPSGL